MRTTENATAAAAQPTHAECREEIIQLLVELSEGRLTPAEIDSSANFFDYGYVDSLSAVEFIARIEENYGVVIEDMELIESYRNVDAIVARVAATR